MNYAVFSDHTIGQSHIRAGMGCEDYSMHYRDPEGRYMIAVICDGHSDPKCFRSARGARMGCEAAVEMMKKMFDAYCGEAGEDVFSRKKEVSLRLRAAILQEWNRKVADDLRDDPVTAEEYASLDTPQYRSAMRYYQAGKGLSNIYGATLAAVAACRDFHLAMQIGDGIAVCLEGQGIYTALLPEDDKEEIEGPASLCDSDLLGREKAFRLDFFPGVPQAMFVTSDGIGDMPLTIPLRESLCLLHRELLRKGGEVPGTEGLSEINQEQSDWLKDFLSYYSGQGLEDDCCLGGFFDLTRTVEDVVLNPQEIKEFRQELEQEYQEKLRQYQDTKARLQKALDESQKQMQTLTAGIDSLRKQLADLEIQLNQETGGSERIRSMREYGERDCAKTRSEYEQKKGGIAAGKKSSLQASCGESTGERDAVQSGGD